MGKVYVDPGIPSDARWVSATLVEGGSCSDPSQGRVVDEISGAGTSDELVFNDVAPGRYAVVKTSLRSDGTVAGRSCEEVTVAPPPPPPPRGKRCEVRDWFEDLTPPPPPPPPRLSHGLRCEVRDWFL